MSILGLNLIKCKKCLGDLILSKNDNNSLYLDFKKIIPIPQSLKIYSNWPLEGETVACFYHSLDYDSQEKLKKMLKNKTEETFGNYWNKYKYHINLVKNNNKLIDEYNEKMTEVNQYFEKDYSSFAEIGKQYILNIKKYGCAEQKEWRINNWGTLHNATDTKVDFNDKTNEYSITFLTDWLSPPNGIIEKINNLNDVEFLEFRYKLVDGDKMKWLIENTREMIDYFDYKDEETCEYSIEDEITI